MSSVVLSAVLSVLTALAIKARHSHIPTQNHVLARIAGLAGLAGHGEVR
jgi:hypothetical protein